MCRVSLVPQFSYPGSHLGNSSICFSFLYLTVSCDVPGAWVEQVRLGKEQEFGLEQSLGRNAITQSPRRTKPRAKCECRRVVSTASLDIQQEWALWRFKPNSWPTQKHSAGIQLRKVHTKQKSPRQQWWWSVQIKVTIFKPVLETWVEKNMRFGKSVLWRGLYNEAEHHYRPIPSTQFSVPFLDYCGRSDRYGPDEANLSQRQWEIQTADYSGECSLGEPSLVPTRLSSFLLPKFYY